MTESTQHKTSDKLKMAKLISLALIISVITYGVVLTISIQENQDKMTSDPNGNIIYILNGIGFMMSIIAFFLNRTLLTAQHIKLHTNPISYFISIHIITWAIFESTCIFGFISAYLSHDIYNFIPLGMITILGILTHPASENRFEQLTKL
jgi:hypothetical protein